MKQVDDWTGPGRLWRTGTAQGTPVLVSHGTFSNIQTCARLASVLGETRPVYVIEWRARDIGWGKVEPLDYTMLADGEMTQAIRYVVGRHGPTHLVAHSGGGLAMALCLARHDLRDAVLSLCAMGSQATHLRHAPLQFRLMVQGAATLGATLGYWPRNLIRIGPVSEASGIMREWLRWNRKGHMFDAQGPIGPRLAAQNLPTLVLAGAGDRVIAPVGGCEVFAEMFGPSGKVEICGTATGYGEDFDHGRMVRSRTAATDLWPRIDDWMSSIDARVLCAIPK